MNDYINLVKSFKIIIFKIITYFMVTNFVVGGILYFLHIGAQRDGLFNEVAEKAHTVGSSLELLVNKAITAGIPFMEIKGLKEYLDKKLTATEELQYIFVTDLKGNVIAQTQNAPNSLSGSLKQFALTTDALKDKIAPFNIFSYFNIPIPIVVESEDNKQYGYIHLGVSVKAVQNKISNIFFDIAIILFVSLVVGFEFIRFTFVNYVATPIADFLSAIERIASGDFSFISSIRAKEGIYKCLEKLNDLIKDYCARISLIGNKFKQINKDNYLFDLIKDYVSELKLFVVLPKNGQPKIAPLAPAVENLRLIIFLFLICEGIMTTIAPNYAGQFYVENSYCSKQFFSALPVLLFVFVSLISLPLSSMLTMKYGFKKTFQIGLFYYGLGFFVGCFSLENIWIFLMCRFFNAIGFAVLYMGFQNYVTTYSQPHMRVKNYSIYLIAQGSAYLTGMPVGGLLVDNIGYFYTFALCLFVTIAALIYACRYIFDYEGFEKKVDKAKFANPFKIHEIPGLSRIVFFLGFPARFLYVALIAVLNPLYLVHIGSSMSVVGRVMMIYGLLTFCISSYSYKLIALFKNPTILVLLCSTLIGVSLLSQFFIPTIQGVVIAITIFSVGTVIHISSMMAILESLAQETKQDSKIIISVYFTYERMAMLLAPFAASTLISHVGYQTTLLTFAIFIFLSIFIFILLQKNQDKPLLQKGSDL